LIFSAIARALREWFRWLFFFAGRERVWGSRERPLDIRDMLAF
jgi:hypothetical protein